MKMRLLEYIVACSTCSPNDGLSVLSLNSMANLIVPIRSGPAWMEICPLAASPANDGSALKRKLARWNSSAHRKVTWAGLKVTPVQDGMILSSVPRAMRPDDLATVSLTG